MKSERPLALSESIPEALSVRTCRSKTPSSDSPENIDTEKMERALIFKEWVKTRMVFFVSLGLAVCIGLYTVAMMNRLIELKG